MSERKLVRVHKWAGMSPVGLHFFTFVALAWFLARVFYLWRGSQAVRWFLLACNVTFIAFSGCLPLVVLGCSVGLNFIIHKLIRSRSEPGQLRALLITGIALNTVLIFSPKFARMGGFSLVLLGLSYYSIVQLIALVDLYEERAQGGKLTVGGEGSLSAYLSFVTFFPQLTAGPICTWRETGKALQAPVPATLEQAFPGLLILLHGLFQKVVVSTVLALLGDMLKAPQTEPNTLMVLIGLTCAYLSLYFDFSGYTDIAIGVAWLFGVRFPLNFNQPLRANSLPDFWARWHMTLSSFVKNYIYFPVFRAYPTSRVAPKLGLVTSMIVVGIWHEPSLRFVTFGLLHGFALLWWPFKGRPKTRFSAAGRWVVTQGFVILTIAFFAQPNMEASLGTLAGLANFRPELDFMASFDNYDKLQIALCFLYALGHTLRGLNTVQALGSAKPTLRLMIWAVGCLCLVVLYSNSGLSRSFIYADF